MAGTLFVVIEGVDGVGKTTIATAMASRIGAAYYRTPSPALGRATVPCPGAGYMNLRDYVDDLAISAPRARFAFYLFAVLEASKHIEELLRSTHVVCDRFISSTLAYYRALDTELRHIDISWAGLLRPDVEVLLDMSDPDEHLARLLGRPEGADRGLERDLGFLARVRAEYGRLGLAVVDTSHRGIETIVEDILGHVAAAQAITPAASIGGI